MNILVCVKRVPATGGRIDLTPDGQNIDTRHLGFTISPHEECAVEEALQLVEKHGGSTTVLTLGPAAAEEQLRDAMAMGIDRAHLLAIDEGDWDAGATAAAIVNAIRSATPAYDLLLFGNESADNGGYQVGVRVAYALDLPCVTGVKALEIAGNKAIGKREIPGGWELFEVALPALFTVKEGINLPRYPSLPGRLKARKKPVERSQPTFTSNRLEKVRLRLPPSQTGQVEILGSGADAAAKAVAIFRKLGVL
jgi:electron transfer flavoprotein beta subunit